MSQKVIYFSLILVETMEKMPTLILIFSLVCREWLVLEDGALAHQLQDQESEFYLK